MATRIEPIQPLEITSLRDEIEERASAPSRGHALAVYAVASVAASAAIVAAALRSSAPIGPGRVLSAALVTLWCASAVLVVRRRPAELLGVVMSVGAATGGLAMLGAALLGHGLSSDTARDVAAALRAVGVAFLPAAAMHLVLGLPDGSLRNTGRRIVVALGDAAALGVAIYLFTRRPELPLAAVWTLAALSGLVGLAGFVLRGSRAQLADRPRFQWVAWATTVAAAIGGGVAILNALVDWPDPIRAIAVGASVLIPISLVIAATPIAVRVDRLLVQTIAAVGLAGLVAACYLLVVLGLGHSPEGTERDLLGLSMIAALVAALLWVPARQRLHEWATRQVYGERSAPDEVLRTFGSRLTRALPLDELLLQLAESLKKTMALERAEVWTRGPTGRLERAVSVPDRGPASLSLGPEEETVVARAGTSGPAWGRVWLSELVPAEEDVILRIAPVTNSGELLGLIVVRRSEGALPFDDDDDQMLTELARQVGLALHNVKLDSALQESLDEVRRQADELRASRARIVEAGDAQRRAIERDLHDGAQQHLVALAVSVRLARQIADRDPDAAKEMLDQIGVDLQDAVQELRNLAHGIYPPLLLDRGLPDALAAAANRAALPVSVEATLPVSEETGGSARYPQPVEAAVYFCVLEALQNAGKHAGPGATAKVTVHEDEGALLFEVADNGAGFDLATPAVRGHGFVNMSDRVGAIGGSVTVDSAPGRGTKISARIPL